MLKKHTTADLSLSFIKNNCSCHYSSNLGIFFQVALSCAVLVASWIIMLIDLISCPALFHPTIFSLVFLCFLFYACSLLMPARLGYLSLNSNNMPKVLEIPLLKPIYHVESNPAFLEWLYSIVCFFRFPLWFSRDQPVFALMLSSTSISLSYRYTKSQQVPMTHKLWSLIARWYFGNSRLVSVCVRFLCFT